MKMKQYTKKNYLEVVNMDDDVKINVRQTHFRWLMNKHENGPKVVMLDN